MTAQIRQRLVFGLSILLLSITVLAQAPPPAAPKPQQSPAFKGQTMAPAPAQA